MPEAGFEPAYLSVYAPQTYVSANSTTPAKNDENIIGIIIYNNPKSILKTEFGK
jgi:hypothetical protein